MTETIRVLLVEYNAYDAEKCDCIGLGASTLSDSASEITTNGAFRRRSPNRHSPFWPENSGVRRSGAYRPRPSFSSSERSDSGSRTRTRDEDEDDSRRSPTNQGAHFHTARIPIVIRHSGFVIRIGSPQSAPSPPHSTADTIPAPRRRGRPW